jgi:hypothetical protein
MADQVGDAVGQGPGFATTSTCHHKEGAVAMLDSPSLGLIQTGQETQGCRGGEFTIAKPWQGDAEPRCRPRLSQHGRLMGIKSIKMILEADAS